MHSQENASDSVLFSTVAGLRAYSLQKRDSILDVFCEICEVLQKTAGGLLLIYNIYDMSLALLASNSSQLTVCLGPPQRTAPKQSTVFLSKIFQITKVEGHIFCG